MSNEDVDTALQHAYELDADEDDVSSKNSTQGNAKYKNQIQ